MNSACVFKLRTFSDFHVADNETLSGREGVAEPTVYPSTCTIFVPLEK